MMRSQDNESIVHHYFEKSAARFPKNIAIYDSRRTVTYRMLNSEANRVANTLIGADVRPGMIVGIYSDMSIQYLTAILGALKAGAVFMPIDVASPDLRLFEYLNIAEPPIMITSSAFEHDLLVRLN